MVCNTRWRQRKEFNVYLMALGAAGSSSDVKKFVTSEEELRRYKRFILRC